MDQLPLVSVMIPVYNGMPLLQYSIKSLLNQTYSRWECIIVDDGSTDGTLDYLKSLTDPRFRVFSFGKNKGRAHARQKALDEARGEFIAMLDADDLYHPEKLERQVSFLVHNPDVSLVSASMCSFGLKCDVTYKRAQDEGIKKFDGNVPPHASSMMRSDIAKGFKYNPALRLGEDADFLKKYLTGRQYALQSDILYYYSELDSVTKTKLRKYYTNGMTAGLKEISSGLVAKGGIRFLLSLGKYIVAKTVYPFIDINKILERRGTPLSLQEKKNLSTLLKQIYPEEITAKREAVL